ncbi:MAG: ParA family protein [Bacteroidetes bacterium]|nr:MAG: ParA family protein [Bacteroidota bacterium]
MILSIAIQKGGSGKTTTAINLAAALQQLGKKVLLIDLDPQANLTQALGFSAEPEPNLYHLLRQEVQGDSPDVAAAILEAGTLRLLPASLELANAELELVSVYGRERILTRLLQQLPPDAYDWIILDCPPSIGMLTINALTASDQVLMPLAAEFLPLKGVQSFMRTFNLVQKQLNPRLRLMGLVLTRYDQRTTVNRDMLDQLIREYGDSVFDTRIRPNVALAKSQEWGVDIFSYDKTSNGAYDYLQLAREVLAKSQRPLNP